MNEEARPAAVGDQQAEQIRDLGDRGSGEQRRGLPSSAEFWMWVGGC
jgi:hypothetical protein